MVSVMQFPFLEAIANLLLGSVSIRTSFQDRAGSQQSAIMSLEGDAPAASFDALTSYQHSMRATLRFPLRGECETVPASSMDASLSALLWRMAPALGFTRGVTTWTSSPLGEGLLFQDPQGVPRARILVCSKVFLDSFLTSPRGRERDELEDLDDFSSLLSLVSPSEAPPPPTKRRRRRRERRVLVDGSSDEEMF